MSACVIFKKITMVAQSKNPPPSSPHSLPRPSIHPDLTDTLRHGGNRWSVSGLSHPMHKRTCVSVTNPMWRWRWRRDWSLHWRWCVAVTPRDGNRSRNGDTCGWEGMFWSFPVDCTGQHAPPRGLKKYLKIGEVRKDNDLASSCWITVNLGT